MGSWRHYIALFGFVILASVLVIVDATTVYSPDPHSCEIIGDTDLYGVGVRIGSYLQWAAIFLAILLAPENAIDAFTAANVLTLAVFISFFNDAIRNELGRPLLGKEMCIVVGESLVLYSTLLPAIIWIYKSWERVKPRLCIQIILYSLMAFTTAFVIATEEAPVQKKDCKSAPKHHTKGSRVFWATFWFLPGIIALGWCLWNLCRFFRSSRRSNSRGNEQDRPHCLARTYGEWNSRLNLVKFYFLMYLVVTPILVIGSTEAGLKHDQISTASATFSSTSQLYPFLCGLFNLLHICWRGFNKGRINWPVTSWYHELRTALNYLMHRNKLSSETVCVRLSERWPKQNRNSSWDSSVP